MYNDVSLRKKNKFIHAIIHQLESVIFFCFVFFVGFVITCIIQQVFLPFNFSFLANLNFEYLLKVLRNEKFRNKLRIRRKKEREKESENERKKNCRQYNDIFISKFVLESETSIYHIGCCWCCCLVCQHVWERHVKWGRTKADCHSNERDEISS